MKKLLLILLCLPMIGFGQPYLNSTSVWLVSDADVFTWQSNDYQFYINGSTTINLYNYHNIYMQGFHNTIPATTPTPISSGPSYLREDGPKWYVYNQTTGVDELLCDFSLTVGNDISSFTASFFLTPPPVITSITNVTLFGSSVRKHFHLDNGFSFIEGVGNLAGLFSGYAQAIEYASGLDCYIQDNQNWGLYNDSLCNLFISSVNTNIVDTNKELLKVTDLLGRETKETNQPLFYIYDDGTVEKRIVIE